MRILIVDDDEPFRLALRNAFVRRGYEVSLAGSPAEAETSLREALPQYAVVDLRMPGGSGLDVVRAFSYFSHLVNIAEDVHQNRRRRAHALANSPPQRGSIAHALERLAAAGIGGDAVAR